MRRRLCGGGPALFGCRRKAFPPRFFDWMSKSRGTSLTASCTPLIPRKTTTTTTTTTTEEDAIVQSTLRRVNRRVSVGVDAVMSGEVAKAKAVWREDVLGEMTRKEEEDDETVVIRTQRANAPGTGTTTTKLMFLHGFGDTASMWEEFARTLVRGMEDSVDVILPSAPKRYYATSTTAKKGNGGELFSGRAWFAPRLLPSRSDYESILAEYEELVDENQAELEKRTFSCAGMKDSFERVKRLVENEYPRKVIVSGFSQGAAMAVSLMCSGEQKPKNLVGCLSFRGYLPRKPDEMKVRSQLTTTTTTTSDSDSDDTIDCNTKTLLMLAGESDPLVPVRWTKEAKVKAELLGLEAHAFFSEGYGHNVTSDDVYRARSWLRSRVA